jgi:hypothetical protein
MSFRGLIETAMFTCLVVLTFGCQRIGREVSSNHNHPEPAIFKPFEQASDMLGFGVRLRADVRGSEELIPGTADVVIDLAVPTEELRDTNTEAAWQSVVLKRVIEKYHPEFTGKGRWLKGEGTQPAEWKWAAEAGVVVITRDIAGGAESFEPITDSNRDVLPGQRMILRVEATRPNVTLANFKWTIQGKTFANYAADETSGKLTPLYPADLDDQKVVYYWADADDNREIQCELTANGQRIVARERMNVKKPEWSFTTKLGRVAIYPIGTIFGLCPTPTTTQGIDFTAEVKVPYGFEEGRWNYVQLVEPGRQRTLADGRVEYDNFEGQWVLDTTYPYEPRPYAPTPGYPGSWPTSTTHTEGDSPRFLLDPTSQNARADDYFQMFVMFLPPGDETRYVPLAKVDWHWGGQVTNASSGWRLTGANQRASSASATSDHPTWTGNVQPASWNNGPITVAIKPTSVAEGAGLVKGQANVSVASRVTTPLAVTLVSSDTSIVTVPNSVTIPAGRSSVGFDFTVLDNAVRNPTREVTVRASAAGYTDGQDTVAVLDND